MSNSAWLVLRDGRTFSGRPLGAKGEASGEVIFNTAMQGYQEILTDPSYRGQIVAMTYPMIGNYGVNDEDVESRRPWVNGFIVKEASPIASNFRAGASLDEYLGRHGIVGIQDIDTRAIADVKRAYDAIDQALDVRQQARFRVFEEQMERRKLELITRARQANRPKQQQ